MTAVTRFQTQPREGQPGPERDERGEADAYEEVTGISELLGELREEKGCEKGSPIPHAGQALGQLEGEGHTDATELEAEIASHLAIQNRANPCQAAPKKGPAE